MFPILESGIFRVSGYSEINKHPLCNCRSDCLLVNFHCFVNATSHQQQLLLSSTIIGTGVWNPDTMLWWQCNNKKDLIHFCCCLKFRDNSESCDEMLFINFNIVFSFYLTDSGSSKCYDSIRQLKRTKSDFKSSMQTLWETNLFDKMCSWYLHPNLLKIFSFNLSTP
jgi:hypothetical protein